MGDERQKVIVIHHPRHHGMTQAMKQANEVIALLEEAPTMEFVIAASEPEAVFTGLTDELNPASGINTGSKRCKEFDRNLHKRSRGVR